MNNSSIHHSFDIDLATELQSIDLAILVHHFQFWIMKNKRMGKNLYENRTWTYQSISEVAAHFPYWSYPQVKRLLLQLVKLKILIKSNFNKTPLDRTVWYAFSDEEKFTIGRFRKMENPESENGKSEIGNCNKDTDTLTDAEKEKEECTFGALALSFFAQLKKINPKIKSPDIHKWANQLRLLAKEGNTYEEIAKVMEYIISTKDKPSSNGFCWANVIQSPSALKKHFSRLWGECTTNSTSNINITNTELLIRIKAISINRKDIWVGEDYVEFVNGGMAPSIYCKINDKDFFSMCTTELNKRKIKLENK